jgi:hypothetical protein
VEKAFTDGRVFHATSYTYPGGTQQPVEVRVSDTAVAAALHLAGQKPADFGFFSALQMYTLPGNYTWAEHFSLASSWTTAATSASAANVCTESASDATTSPRRSKCLPGRRRMRPGP